MLKSKLSLFPLLVMTLSLIGCDKTKEVLGLTRTSPDEMQVIERPPLSMPPDFGLRPREPNQHKNSPEMTPRDNAKVSVLGKEKTNPTKTQTSQEKSITEAELLKKANAEATDPDIRSKITQEAQNSKSSIGEQLAFWTDNKQKGKVIDPKEENEKFNGSQMPGQTQLKSQTVATEADED